MKSNQYENKGTSDVHLTKERNYIIIMEKQISPSIRNTKTYTLVVTALMAAVTCILAPLSIPIGPVPISLTNLAIYISLYVLDWKKGTISYLVYLLIGLVGVPVFSGFTGGVAKLAGPTGGYIIGFIPMAIIAGIAIDKYQQRWIHLIGMIIGTVVCYAFGTLWFCLQSGTPLMSALSLCVFPFIPGDLIKMIIAIAIAPIIREKIDKIKFSQN